MILLVSNRHQHRQKDIHIRHTHKQTQTGAGMKTDTQTNTDTDTWTQHTDTHPAMPYLPSSLLASVFSALFYVNQRRFVLGNLKFETLTFENDNLAKKKLLGEVQSSWGDEPPC